MSSQDPCAAESTSSWLPLAYVPGPAGTAEGPVAEGSASQHCPLPPACRFSSLRPTWCTGCVGSLVVAVGSLVVAVGSLGVAVRSLGVTVGSLVVVCGLSSCGCGLSSCGCGLSSCGCGLSSCGCGLSRLSKFLENYTQRLPSKDRCQDRVCRAGQLLLSLCVIKSGPGRSLPSVIKATEPRDVWIE